ncbi:ABC transporter permease [Pradoshia sp.]
MMISMQRIKAIFIKDYKDFSRNTAVFIVIFLPILMAAFFDRMGTPSIDTHFMSINMAFILVATYVQCCLIAEEKEKNTLRNLMLSPAKTVEILLGKGLLSFVLTIIVVFFSAFLSEYQPAEMTAMVIALLLSTVFYISVGTLLGLFSKSIVEASVTVLPAMGLLLFGPFAVHFAEKYPVLSLFEWLPSSQLIELAKVTEGSHTSADILIPILVITAWIVCISLLTAWVFQKQKSD